MKLTVKNARLSFPSLFTPEAFEDGGSRRFGCALLVSKDDTENVEAIEAAIDEAGIAKFGEAKWNDSKFRKTVKMNGWRDGEDKSYDGYEGHYFISANRSENNGPPTVVDRDRNRIQESDGVIYGGCYVNAIVEFYGDDRYGKAINCALGAVQFFKDGDAFSGGGRVSPDEFEALDDDEEDMLG